MCKGDCRVVRLWSSALHRSAGLDLFCKYVQGARLGEQGSGLFVETLQKKLMELIP